LYPDPQNNCLLTYSQGHIFEVFGCLNKIHSNPRRQSKSMRRSMSYASVFRSLRLWS
jgi:hypothetical protein